MLPLLGLVIAGSWLVRDLEPVPGVGYREALQQLLSGPGAGPVFAVGGDAAMFSYYLGAPLNVLESANDLDHLQRTEPAIRVGYHDVPWNSEEHQRMHALLVRRCRSERVAQLILFQCGK